MECMQGYCQFVWIRVDTHTTYTYVWICVCLNGAFIQGLGRRCRGMKCASQGEGCLSTQVSAVATNPSGGHYLHSSTHRGLHRRTPTSTACTLVERLQKSPVTPNSLVKAHQNLFLPVSAADFSLSDPPKQAQSLRVSPLEPTFIKVKGNRKKNPLKETFQRYLRPGRCRRKHLMKVLENRLIRSTSLKKKPLTGLKKKQKNPTHHSCCH